LDIQSVETATVEMIRNQEYAYEEPQFKLLRGAYGAAEKAVGSIAEKIKKLRGD
jgi:hypothetical protein